MMYILNFQNFHNPWKGMWLTLLNTPPLVDCVMLLGMFLLAVMKEKEGSLAITHVPV
jgi:hypothetical protein